MCTIIAFNFIDPTLNYKIKSMPAKMNRESAGIEKWYTSSMFTSGLGRNEDARDFKRQRLGVHFKSNKIIGKIHCTKYWISITHFPVFVRRVKVALGPKSTPKIAP